MTAPIRFARVQAYASPDTLPHDPPASRCARSCCWVPYNNLCGRNRQCACHEGDEMADRVPVPMLRAMFKRDGHTCVMTGQDTDRIVPQHRQGGMGGRRSKHRLDNLLPLDSIINGLIESDPDLQAVAKAWGVKVSIHGNTEQIPVYYAHEFAWFLLQGDGRVEITAVEALERMHAFYGPEYLAWKAVADQTERAGVLWARGR